MVVSGIVIDHTFTSGSVNKCTHLFFDHRPVNVFVHVLDFHGQSQPRNYFNSEIFPIRGTVNFFFGNISTINYKYPMNISAYQNCCYQFSERVKYQH